MLQDNRIDLSWQAQANCAGKLPVKRFYVAQQPYKNQLDEKRELAEVKALCRACPVQAECIEHATKYEKFGTWGGETEVERRSRIRSSRRKSRRKLS